MNCDSIKCICECVVIARHAQPQVHFGSTIAMIKKISCFTVIVNRSIIWLGELCLLHWSRVSVCDYYCHNEKDWNIITTSKSHSKPSAWVTLRWLKIEILSCFYLDVQFFGIYKYFVCEEESLSTQCVLLFFLLKSIATSKSLCLDIFKLYTQDCFIMITMHFVGNDTCCRYQKPNTWLQLSRASHGRRK